MLFEASKKIKKDGDSGKAPRLAALHFMKALDHAFSFVVGGLKTFASTGSVPVLKPGEVRYVVDRKRPCPFAVPSHVKQLRSCNYNVDTKQALYDVKLSERGGSLCCFHYDEGPKDLPVFWYLPHVGFRCVGLNDPLHRVGRDMYEAATEADMWGMILDSTAVLNWDHGPYLSAANFRKSVEVAERSMAVGHCDDEVWALVFPGICEDDGDDQCADYGSNEHAKRVHANLGFEKCFERKSDKVKWVRWGSHHWALKEFLPCRHRKLYVLLLQLVEAGCKLSAGTLMALGLLNDISTQASFVFVRLVC